MKNLITLAMITIGSFAFGQTCNIEQNDIFELNQFGSDDVFFYTAPNSIQNPSANNYTYTWEFNFENGNFLGSNEREPIIAIPCSNKVTYTKVTVSNGTCTKVIEKTWRPKVCGPGNLIN